VIELFDSWRQSPVVPADWLPVHPPGAISKVKIKNILLFRRLQDLLPGRWQKVYHYGRDGTEIHYFQHASGRVTMVKHKRKTR
jgi:hypothetical protein